MIWILPFNSVTPVRARCLHCAHRLRADGYMANCCLKQDKDGAFIVDKVVPLKKYACEKFVPRPKWSVYDSQIQLTLNF